MIVKPSCLEAQKVPGVVLVKRVADDQWEAYVEGDELPPQPTPDPNPVPDSVTMRQARLALFGAGKLAAVDAAIASMPSPYKEAAQIEWEFSGEVRRRQPLVLQLGPALGLTTEQIDNLFRQAATL
jgi:hypothetical protein